MQWMATFQNIFTLTNHTDKSCITVSFLHYTSVRITIFTTTARLAVSHVTIPCRVCIRSSRAMYRKIAPPWAIISARTFAISWVWFSSTILVTIEAREAEILRRCQP